MVFATKAHTPDPERPEITPPGVLTYIRTQQDHDALLWIDAEGRTVSESPVRILRQAKCTPETPALPRRADHHPLVARATKIVEDERKDMKSGQLGSRRGAHYRAYENSRTTFATARATCFSPIRSAPRSRPFTTTLSPPKRWTNSTANSALISDDALAELVTTLHRDDRLVVVSLHDGPPREPSILCSLGLAD